MCLSGHEVPWLFLQACNGLSSQTAAAASYIASDNPAHARACPVLTTVHVVIVQNHRCVVSAGERVRSRYLRHMFRLPAAVCMFANRSLPKMRLPDSLAYVRSRMLEMLWIWGVRPKGPTQNRFFGNISAAHDSPAVSHVTNTLPEKFCEGVLIKFS
jgi:hypothetical protein